MTITVTEKRCTRCGETIPVGGFHRNRSSRDGLDARCKDCMRAYSRARYGAHREEKLAYQCAYREGHREEHRAYYRAYARDRSALLGDPTMDRWKEITAKYATRSGEPWSEAEDAYLAASTERVVDDALALKRTYMSVSKRIGRLRRNGVALARDQQAVAA